MTDPIIQAAIDRATDELTRLLTPVTWLKDPQAAARNYVEAYLLDGPDHWWPHPPAPGHRKPGTGDPPNDEFLSAKAEIQTTPREETP